ncbi:MAG: methylmalonyl-CoA mutase family protein [Oligoflexia bacterium]|nr:methylmalonyl-CoA mutase family protein [Oligoflexia bacterium]
MKDLKNANEQTPSGLSIDPVYDEKREALPGEYPYLRGIHKNMYRGRLWTMRQYAGFGTAEESNKRYRYLLSQGTTGLSVAFDLPTQMGYDSDHAMAKGEIGRVGVAIDTIDDMRILFHKINLSSISTSMTINSTASILLALYIAVAQEQKADLSSLSGTVQNDLLKEYIARGTYIFPPKESLRVITDMFSYCKSHVPKWNPISISGYHIREAGSTAAQEIAFTLANGFTYVDAALKAGLSIDEFAPRLSFFFNAHNHIFEETAKFRVARKIWAERLKNHYQAKSDSSLKLRFHAQTAGSMLTAQQPENNIVRVGLQALAAILGGAQSLHTNGFDEALSLPTEDSAKLALRTQQIIAYESGAADTADPLGGSYFVNDLSKRLEEVAMEYLSEIERRGGMIACIESGYIQKEIQEAAYKTQLAMDQGDQIQVGVNAFQESISKDPVLMKIDTSLQKKQLSRVSQFKKKRNQKEVEQALLNLKNTASSSNNLMPVILEAVKKNCTLGEITQSLKTVFGTHKEILTI